MKTDIKQDIGNRLVQMIKDMGEPIWRMPWVFAQPETAFGGKDYRGINQAITAMYRMANGQKSHLWLTRKKIDELAGWKWDASKNRKVKDRDNKLNVYLRTGCHGVPIVYWSFIPKKDSDGNVMKDKEGNELTYPMLRSYTVFNSDDVIGFDFSSFEPKEPVISDPMTCEEYSDMMLSSYSNHPSVIHGGNRAFYSLSSDTVVVPDMERFDSPVEYASTLAHELGHSTGHPSRLNRKFGANFGDDTYSKEELVAEFTASMVLAQMGIMDRPSDNSAAYLKCWLKKIGDDPSLLFDAISQAKKACDMITGNTSDKEDR